MTLELALVKLGVFFQSLIVFDGSKYVVFFLPSRHPSMNFCRFFSIPLLLFRFLSCLKLIRLLCQSLCEAHGLKRRGGGAGLHQGEWGCLALPITRGIQTLAISGD